MLGECGTKRAMSRQRPRKTAQPLDGQRLDALALHYVGRFATTRAKLVQYLHRKLRERGWGRMQSADPEANRGKAPWAWLYRRSRLALTKRRLWRAGLGDGGYRSPCARRERRRGLCRRACACPRRRCSIPHRLAGGPPAWAICVRGARVPLGAREGPGSNDSGRTRFDRARIIDLAPGDEEGMAELRQRFAPTDQ